MHFAVGTVRYPLPRIKKKRRQNINIRYTKLFIQTDANDILTLEYYCDHLSREAEESCGILERGNLPRVTNLGQLVPQYQI